VTGRRACRVLGQARTTQRYQPIIRDDEDPLTAAVIRLAGPYGRYGYRRVTALLHAEGWQVNPKRVARIWRRERLKVPVKQPKRGRLWLNDGSFGFGRAGGTNAALTTSSRPGPMTCEPSGC